MDDMSVAQPVLFALQWSLCELWTSWGMTPDVVLGHSIGECAAACVAGLFSLEDGLALAARPRAADAVASADGRHGRRER
jgi:acyl transferase domain-containing protein